MFCNLFFKLDKPLLNKGMNIKTEIQSLLIALIVILIFSSAQLYPQCPEFKSSKNALEENISSKKNYLVIGFSYANGYMISHAKEVVNLRGLNPRTFELDINWHLNNDDVWNDCHSYPRVGAFLAYHDYENDDLLGHGFSGGISFVYFFGLPSDFNFHIKGKGGASYLTKPYDKSKNPQNMAYATHLNYLISIGAGISFKLHKQMEIQIDGSMNHQSNAAYLEPNGGINYWAIALSTNYFLDKPQFKERNIPDTYLTSDKKTRWDFSVSWGISSMPYPMPGQVPMYGLTVLRSWQTWRFVAFTFAAELERNGRAVEITRRINPELDVDPLRASLLGGVEFLMGSTIFSIQIGAYVHRSFVEKDDVYQRWGLMYSVFNSIYAGLNFKSYRNSADHLSLRVTLSF
jgi:hypothetical protein